jgi:ankyrin repeat protein
MEALAFWTAVVDGNEGEVERLLEQDAGLLHVGTVRAYTPFILATYSGHVGVVRCLLDKGAAIDERGSAGWTALVRACHDGRTPVVRLLLERGADPAIANDMGWTPLMLAASEDQLEVVRLLLDHPRARATINHRTNNRGLTALMGACLFGCPGVVRALLESGADPTIASTGGCTPMDVAKDAELFEGVTVEGRRGCVAALEVRFPLPLCCPLPEPNLL